MCFPDKIEPEVFIKYLDSVKNRMLKSRTDATAITVKFADAIAHYGKASISP